MVISISNTGTVVESSVAIPSPTPIMEDTVAYVPPQAMVVEEDEQISFISKVRLQPNPPGTSKRKRFSSHKKEAAPPPEDKEEVIEIRLPGDFPPKPYDALRIKTSKMQTIHYFEK